MSRNIEALATNAPGRGFLGYNAVHQAMHYVRSLTELDRTDLALAGGKGANLGALMKAGLPVPPGFCVTTEGYRRFVADNQLEPELRRILSGARLDRPSELDSASEEIRARFRAGRVATQLAEELSLSYAEWARRWSRGRSSRITTSSTRLGASS